MTPSRTYAAAATPLLASVALFALYAATACRTVGPGDSGELAVALTTWGVPHAPGYPLLALIGNLVTHALPGVEPALALDLLNAAFAAAACGVLAAAVTTVTGETAAGLVAGLVLGTSRTFWLHALALEVFSLNALLAAVMLYVCARMWADPPASRAGRRLLPALALVTTGALTHHQTLVLLAAPAWVVWWLALRPRAGRARGDGIASARAVGLAAALGLVPLLYIPIAAALDPPLSWGDARGLEGLIGLIARRDFGGGTLLPPPLVVEQVLRHGERASPLGQRNLLAFWTDLPRDFGWAFPALAALGLVWLWRRARALAALVLLFLILLAAFFTRVNTPIVPLYRGVTERFHILPHVVLALCAGCAVAQLAAWGRTLRSPRGIAPALALAVTAAPMLFVNAPRVDQRDNTFTADFGSNLISGMPERAVFFSSGDLFHNAFLYQTEALGGRRDLDLVHQDLMPLGWYVRELRRRGAIRLPEGMTAMSSDSTTWSRAWLDLNADPARPGARPAVAVKLADDSYRPRWRLVPLGLWSRAALLDEPVGLAAWEATYAAVVGGWNLRSLDRRYAEDSWEATEEVFYPYALGQLLGLRDVIALAAPETRVAPIPALEAAAAWQGERGAELLAQRADFIRAWLEEPTQPVDPEKGARLATRAVGHARAALALEHENVQGLQTLAALLAAHPELGSVGEEVRVRAALADRRPGELGEIVPYLRLARRLAAETTLHDPEIERHAEATRARLVKLLVACDRLDPRLGLAQEAARWDRPLGEIPELK